MAELTLSMQGWNTLRRLHRTPAGPILARLFGSRTPAEVAARIPRSSATIEDVTVDPRSDTLQMEAIENLRQNGVVTLPGFFDRELCLAALKESDALLETIRTNVSEEQASGEVLGALWQTDLAVLDSYVKIAAHPRPVVNIRSRRKDQEDGGMIDIFAVEKMITDDMPNLQRIIELVKGEPFSGILSAVTDHKCKQFNLYRNDSVTNPRRLHVDTIKSTYKIFIYLSDVNKLSDGPYSYVPGSQAGGNPITKITYLNTVRNQYVTDMPPGMFDPLYFLGPAGTVTISCQTGIHGGAAQVQGSSRTVLVSNYN